MGLIRLAKIGVDAIGSTLGDQWLEYFYCDSIDSDTLMVKGQKKVNDGHNYNTKGMQDNIISNGSVIAVNEGQCMMIVDNGKSWISVQRPENSNTTTPPSLPSLQATSYRASDRLPLPHGEDLPLAAMQARIRECIISIQKKS